ncbi:MULTISPECIES: NAD(P)/FAD-dependent oxidoreductase [Methanosarcina]|uniref:Geranylgeranyl/isoprenyl reductase n=3 Tax=Methanosarcina barkeri TaxID=2208 RepID=A0A0E3QZI9_METBA|nr:MULTISPECIES: NAD(P)/FAD-dependent oxidoreductase [Methanosarcina]AKB56344.1 Geranylgeranyl/isoprenyl reductase [Methanosarcina barkeri MS]AKB59815.1 Geranylgeranyl/isoprenyl reductase [Methanosarcina barkeri 227]AKJ40466.1 geranylgeranyl reductase family protein [Methanosarcina barkeri CM1]OEC90289.1 FAD-dependent oxidoreductase [Methanosarcina sp. A14]
MDADIIVIGASPAGMMAARSACEKGAAVLLLEKKEEIGHPPHPANSFFKGMLDKCGEKVDPSYVLHNLKGMKIISPSGRTVEVETTGYAIDKTAFDRFYAKKIMKTGVDLRTGVEVQDIQKEGDKFTVNTSAGVFTSKLVIISDGINSKIASLVGLKTMKHPEDIAWGIELDIKSPGLGKPEMFEYYVGNHAPGWKTTYSPRGGDNAAIGAYVRRCGTDATPYLNAWVENFKKLKGLEELEVVRKLSGGDPIVTIPKEYITDGIMVVGGAAGQSGIGYAMRAGQICGDVAADAISKGNISKSALLTYRKTWEKEFLAEHYLGRIGLETLRKMTDREIDEMARVFEKEDLSFIHGSSVEQAMQVFAFMLKKKPSAILKFRALLRNK